MSFWLKLQSKHLSYYFTNINENIADSYHNMQYKYTPLQQEYL